MKTEKMKNLFEHQFITRRTEGLEDQCFDTMDNSYLEQKIFEFFPSNLNDPYYVSLLVDLAVDKEILSDRLFNIFHNVLFQKCNYLLKLSILDYLFLPEVRVKIEKRHLDDLQKLSVSKQEFIVVRNQAILLLICFEQNEEYTLILTQNIKRTTDYRAHIRLYNTYLNYECLAKNIEIKELLEISKKKDLGNAVDQKIKEIESEML